MHKTEDLRVIKTKNSLHNAFFAMLEEMSIEDISINSLCERANIRRATFYKHFSDKLDFFTYIVKDIRSDFDMDFAEGHTNTTFSVEYYVKYIEAVVSFLIKHENAINKILNSPMRSVFIEIFMQQNYLATLERLKKSVTDGMIVCASLESVASMLVGGISVNILYWFENRETESASDMIREITKIMSTMMR